MALAAQRGRIAAFTAVALLALFASQPLHGAAAVFAESGSPLSATSIAADPGAATPGAHRAHLCPLCGAASQARVAIHAASHAAPAEPSFQVFSFHALQQGPAHAVDLCATGPRAPPRSLSPLV